jgi:hypothetical protein
MIHLGYARSSSLNIDNVNSNINTKVYERRYNQSKELSISIAPNHHAETKNQTPFHETMSKEAYDDCLNALNLKDEGAKCAGGQGK